MARNPAYTKHQPAVYRPRVPIFWWVHKWPYLRFMLREFSSIFVALYALILLFLVRAVAQGPEAYANFLAWLRTPFAIILHIVILGFVLFHSVTWFYLAPKATVLRVGGKRVPSVAIQAANYIAWGVLSLVLAWIIWRA